MIKFNDNVYVSINIKFPGMCPVYLYPIDLNAILPTRRYFSSIHQIQPYFIQRTLIDDRRPQQKHTFQTAILDLVD